METMTRDVLAFQAGGGGLEQIMQELHVIAYQYPLGKRGMCEDDCGDFLMHVSPRIETMVHRFEYNGIEFLGYYRTTLRFQMRSYRRHRHRRLVAADLEAQSHIIRESDGSRNADEVHESEETMPSCGVTSLERLGLCRPGTARKSLLILVLSHAHELDDGDICFYAGVIGIEKNELRAHCARLHELSATRQSRRQKLRVRRNTAYSGMMQASREVCVCSDAYYRSQAGKRYEHYRSVFRNACRDLAHMRSAPAHAEIAQVLGIPKGTVDSCLHNLRRHAYRTLAKEQRSTGQEQHPD